MDILQSERPNNLPREESADNYKQLDPISKQKANYEFKRYTEALEKFDKVKYRWAAIIEALVAGEYDVSEWYNDDQLNDLLDWKVDHEMKHAQESAVARERFNYNDALRQARKRTKATNQQ